MLLRPEKHSLLKEESQRADALRRAAVRRSNGVIVCLLLFITTLPAFAISENIPKAALSETRAALEVETKKKEALSKELAEMDSELNTLRGKTIALTRNIRQHEQELIDREAEMLALQKQAHEKAKELADRQQEFQLVARGMRRMQQVPPVALLVKHDAAQDWNRQSWVIRHTSLQLQSRAAELKTSITSLNELHESMDAAGEAINARQKLLDREYTALQRRLEEKQLLYKELNEDKDANTKKMAHLSKKATSLKALIEELNREESLADVIGVPQRKPNAPDTTASGKPVDFISAKGQLPLPAAGRIITGYGEMHKGEESKGLYIQSRSGAQVIATYDGKVVFSGPFRDYGNMVIIRHENSYYSLLAGMDRIHTAPGQQLKQNEPVGVMRAHKQDTPTLYMELRKHSKAIDPGPWMAHGTQLTADIR